MHRRNKNKSQSVDKLYNSYTDVNIPDTMLTPSEAVSLNRDTPNNAFMQRVGDELYYPEELQPAVTNAGLSSGEYAMAMNRREGEIKGAIPMRNFLNTSGVKTVAGAMAVPAAGMALGEILPALPTMLTTMMNPVTAKTTAGAVASTALDAYGLVSGLRGMSNSWNKMRSGNFTFTDLPQTLLDFTTAIPGNSVLTSPKSMRSAVQLVNSTVKPYIDFAKSRAILKRINDAQEMFNLHNIPYNVAHKAPSSRSADDIWGLSYFLGKPEDKVHRVGRQVKYRHDGAKWTERMDTVDEAIARMNEIVADTEGTMKNASDVYRKIAHDVSRVPAGGRVELIDDNALSKDSAPLLHRLFLKNAGEGRGTIYPIIDDGSYRMIHLNSYGRNPKSLARIDSGIEKLREATGDYSIPGRVSLFGQHFIPAVGFKTN